MFSEAIMSKEITQSPTTEEWRALYEDAIRIKSLAPWEWMTEDEIFGVKDPETGETGYVSVMGALGEHLSVTVYLGAQALDQFWLLVTDSYTVNFRPETVLEIPQLQLSFQNRDELTKKDRDIIKSLGLKFRGRMTWPMFRSIWPGHFPWHLTGWEARFLHHVLQQTLEVTPRLKEDPEALLPEDEENGLYLVRTPRKKGDALIWEDAWTSVSTFTHTVPLVMDMNLLRSVKRLPKSKASIEMDFFALPFQIQEKRGERPFLPYMLLSVEREHGIILDSDIMVADPDLTAMKGKIPLKIVELFARLKMRPRVVYVRDDYMASYLEKLANELGFKIRITPTFRYLDGARKALLEHF